MTTAEAFERVARRELEPQQAAELLMAADRARWPKWRQWWYRVNLTLFRGRNR